jgi:glycosyltransferase involved in cell wall biosynthesis
MPQVSVVIPVYNSAGLIGTALRSVFAQTFGAFEVIVVDDGSTDRDELEGALAPWRERIVCVRQPNGGPGKARNTGIHRATAPLVAFLDADDEWLPEKLRLQVEYFERYPETGLLHTGVVKPGARSGAAIAGPPAPAFCDLFHTRFFINTLTVMAPRRVLEEVGGFDERREIHIEDWDLWLRIAARHPLGYIAEPLAYHRPGGLMSSQVERTYSSQELVVAKNEGLCAMGCAVHRADPERCLQLRRHVLYHDWAYDRLEAGDHRGARALLGRALRQSPFDARSALLYTTTFLSPALRQRLRRVSPKTPAAAPRTLPPAAPSSPVKNHHERASTPAVTLVHDTMYRRHRRRAIARMHDLDDGLFRSSHSRRRILFEAASPMSFAVFRPIYERLRTDPRIELWFTACADVWQPHEIYGRAGIRDNVVTPGTARWMKVDAYVNADFWDMTWLHRRTRRIHFFHGVAGKYGLDAPVDLAPTIAAFDSLMFVNRDRRDRYIEAGLIPDRHPQAALVGYPKTDCLVDGSLDRGAILRSLGLDAQTPTIMYAPTWSPYSSLNAIGEALIAHAAAEGVQLIVKLHDRSYDRRPRGSGGIDWTQRLRQFASLPTVRVVREADGSPYLFVADALISDHSSIAFEYMLLDRPIVVVDQPELVDRAGINPEKVRRLHAAADVVTDPLDAVRTAIAALDNPHRYSEVRRRTADELFYRPGTATDRAVALIYELMEMPEHAARADSSQPALRAAG